MLRISLVLIICSCFWGFSQPLVNEILIEGNSKLKTSFINSMTRLAVGKPLDSAIIKQDILQLKRLESVSNATFSVTELNGNGYRVNYHIEENFTIIPYLNIYKTYTNTLAGIVGLYNYNTFGRNIALGGYVKYDNLLSYALNFRAPYLFSRRFGASVNVQDLKTLEPVFNNNSQYTYTYNNKGIEVLALYQLNFKNKIELGVNSFIETYIAEAHNAESELPQTLTVHKKLYKWVYEYDNLNYNYYLISGFKSQLYLQYVTASNPTIPTFYIGWNDFLYFKPFGNRINWANRLRVGLASNNNTPFAPFAIDNNTNLRGVGNTVFRGTGVLALNTETRITLIEKKWFVLQGNAFVDAGAWRVPGSRFNHFVRINIINVYSGIGFRLMHKKIYNAIFRIDYGFGITPNASQGIVFGIGQFF